MMIKQILPKFSYLALLLFLVVFFILAPFFSKGLYARLVLDLSVIGLLVLSVYICSDNKRSLIVALLMVTPALVRLLYPTVEIDEITLICNATFLAYVIYIILNRLFHTEDVSIDVIYAAVAVYVLIGVFWGIIYTVLESFWVGSFDLPKPTGQGTTYSEFGQDMLYFSFITMATVGYGDIIPLSQPAKFLSVLEAMIGQIYLTVLVARLVGMYTSSKLKKKDS